MKEGSYDETINAVVIGAYCCKNKRVGGYYGSYLLAIYDDVENTFQTVCKIRNGLSLSDLKFNFFFFQKYDLKKPKNNYQFTQPNIPDVWFEPIIVWEVKFSDITYSQIYKAAYGCSKIVINATTKSQLLSLMTKY